MTDPDHCLAIDVTYAGKDTGDNIMQHNATSMAVLTYNTPINTVPNNIITETIYADMFFNDFNAMENS
jgi:hypothetical protein